MATSPLSEQILDDVQRLSPAQQRQVLDYVQALVGTTVSTTAVKSGRSVAQLAGSIPLDNLREIEQAIEEGCEQFDPHGW